MKRRNPRKLPLDALIPRIEEVNEYIREGMKHRLSGNGSQEYRPITVNRSKQTVTFHFAHFWRGEEQWKDSDSYPAKTKSELSEIREELTRTKRLLTGWMRRSHSPKTWKKPPVYTKRSGTTGRFTKNPRKDTYEEWKASYVPSVVEQAQSTFFRIGNYVLVEPPRHHARRWNMARWENTKTGQRAVISTLRTDGKYRLSVDGEVIGDYASMKGAAGALRRRDKIKRNPRQISEQAAQALMDGERFKSGNTKVSGSGEKWGLYLHGHKIAEYHADDGVLWITTAGYSTMTTKERLNALPGVSVHTAKKQLHLNGAPWDGNWIEVI